jgi:hypothetical protein
MERRKMIGSIGLAAAVGLGVDVDEAMLATIAADSGNEYKWRGAKNLPDGSVSDY